MRHEQKRAYPTQRVAIRAALRASRRSGDRLRVYRCDQCPHWHLTSWTHPATGNGRATA